MELTWGAPPDGLRLALEPLMTRGTARAGLAYVDLETNRGWALDDAPRPAASLVKTALAVVAYQLADQGELPLRERVAVAPLPEDDEAEFDDLGNAPAGKRFAWRKVLDRMITESDNAATNALIDRLGLTALDGLASKLGWQHTALKRRMLDAAAREAGRENFTTPSEHATLLAALHQGRLLGPASTAELLGLLGQQRHDDKLAAGLPADRPFAHKTGELPGFRHDAGIVGGDRPYVLVALGEGEDEETDLLLRHLATVIHAHHEAVSRRTQEAREWLAQATEDPRRIGGELCIEAGDPPVLAGTALSIPANELGLGVQAKHPELQPGVVLTGCLQLRAGPGHARELVSQLRLGDPVEIIETGEDWHRLRGPDGYVAYGKSNNTLLTADWQPTHMVVKPCLRVAMADNRELVLSAGTRLTQAGDRFRLPDGLEIALPDGVAPLGQRGDVAGILAFARQFLGLPYLWGGTTYWGLDCSGLVQLSHAVNGYQLPRDADQQQEATAHIAAAADLQAGDLVFFPGHVGLFLGEGRYLHASAKVGCVTINSFVAGDPVFAPELLASFTGGGRSPAAR
ncbi:MAG: peptidase [Cyanobacteria bacterium RYN_339]|nr:peptidase [Cyanobacteria bacterium RYN_339]